MDASIWSEGLRFAGLPQIASKASCMRADVSNASGPVVDNHRGPGSAMYVSMYAFSTALWSNGSPSWQT